MKKKLPKNWQPSESLYSLLKKRGMPREWVGHQIDGFKLYWIDAGLMMQSWDTVFNRWVSKDWEKVDKRRMYRDEYKPKTELGEKLIKCRKSVIERGESLLSFDEINNEPMSSEKRIEFADYLSRSRNGNI